MTSEMEQSNPTGLLTALARKDTVFMSLPVFLVDEEDRRRKQALTYETDITLDDKPGTFKWQVSGDPSYGFPDVFDRKVFKILEALILENERPINNPVHFSLYRILKVLGLPPFGVHITRVRSAVQRIASVKIHAQFVHTDGEASAHQSQTFHIFDEVVFQEEIFDDEMGAGNHKLTLSPAYLASLNSGYIQPVGFEELQSLQHPISGRLHEILQIKFSDPVIREQKSWTIPYTELCDLIPVRAVGWMSSPKRHFEDIHTELIGYDIVDRVEWEKTDDGWTIEYVPGLVLLEMPVANALPEQPLPDNEIHEETTEAEASDQMPSSTGENEIYPEAEETGEWEESAEPIDEESTEYTAPEDPHSDVETFETDETEQDEYTDQPYDSGIEEDTTEADEYTDQPYDNQIEEPVHDQQDEYTDQPYDNQIEEPVHDQQDEYTDQNYENQTEEEVQDQQDEYIDQDLSTDSIDQQDEYTDQDYEINEPEYDQQDEYTDQDLSTDSIDQPETETFEEDAEESTEAQVDEETYQLYDNQIEEPVQDQQDDETDQDLSTDSIDQPETEMFEEDAEESTEAQVDEGFSTEAPEEEVVEDSYFSEPEQVDGSAAEVENIPEDTEEPPEAEMTEADIPETLSTSPEYARVSVAPDVSSSLSSTLSFEGGSTMSQNGDTLCNIQYALAWTTRSRDQVLNDDVALRTRSLIREICAIHEAKINRGVVAPDYVHIEVNCPPTLTPAALVNDLKERTLNALQAEFPDLEEQYWGLPLWSSGFMCVTTGDDAEAQLNQYLDAKRPADDETFQVIPAP